MGENTRRAGRGRPYPPLVDARFESGAAPRVRERARNLRAGLVRQDREHDRAAAEQVEPVVPDGRPRPPADGRRACGAGRTGRGLRAGRRARPRAPRGSGRGRRRGCRHRRRRACRRSAAVVVPAELAAHGEAGRPEDERGREQKPARAPRPLRRGRGYGPCRRRRNSRRRGPWRRRRDDERRLGHLLLDRRGPPHRLGSSRRGGGRRTLRRRLPERLPRGPRLVRRRHEHELGRDLGRSVGVLRERLHLDRHFR